MKNLKLFAIITFCVLTFQTAKTQDIGKVYFIRSTGFFGSATNFTTFIDQKLVCKLNNKKYSIHEITPGLHIFTVQFDGTTAKEKAEPIEINIEAGKTYYIELILKTGAIVNNLYCIEVNEKSANVTLKNCKEDTDCL